MWLWASASAVAAVAAVVWWLRRRYVAVRVDGPSMEPSYLDGDMVLVRRTTRVERGQVVAFIPRFAAGVTPSAKGGRLWLLKRVAAAPGDPVPADLGPALAGRDGHAVPGDSFVAVGDNRAVSSDSRHEGFIALRRVRGVVVRKL